MFIYIDNVFKVCMRLPEVAIIKDLYLLVRISDRVKLMRRVSNSHKDGTSTVSTGNTREGIDTRMIILKNITKEEVERVPCTVLFTLIVDPDLFTDTDICRGVASDGTGETRPGQCGEVVTTVRRVIGKKKRKLLKWRAGTPIKST